MIIVNPNNSVLSFYNSGKFYAFIFFILFIFCLVYSGFAQNPEIKRTYHWYFGNRAGIDFSSGIAVADTNGKFYGGEGAATISDTLGNLLFYTNGITVWNSIHDTMPNGTGLLGGPSSTQAALIVPNPGNKDQYYIFTSDNYPPNNGYRYSIVDMTLDSGNGDIITSSKNSLLLANSTEKLIATRHCNKNNYWVVTHGFNSNSFFTYLVDSNGINLPIVSNIGKTITSIYNDCVGYMKISPNGKKIAVAYHLTDSIQIFDFNNKTGVISNPLTIVLPNPSISPGGISFSPNSNLFYVLERKYFNVDKLLQFNLLAGDSTSILNSKTFIGNIGDSTSSSIQMQNGAIQIAPDGKIYLAIINITGGTIPGDKLGIINYPDSLGIGCDFISEGFNLNGKYCKLGLPNFIDCYFNSDTTNSDCSGSLVNSIDDDFIFKSYPNPADGIITIYSNKIIKQIIIYNSLGEKIYDKHFSNNESLSYIYIDCSNLTSGIYQLITIFNEYGNISNKTFIIK